MLQHATAITQIVAVRKRFEDFPSAIDILAPPSQDLSPCEHKVTKNSNTLEGCLPSPQLVAYSRNHDHTPCPRCDHLAYRHTSGQRTLHDLGDLSTGCPVDLLVIYSSHYCSKCRKHFNIDLSDVAPPGGHYTHRVTQLAVRLVVEDGLPYRPTSCTCGAITAVCALCHDPKLGRGWGEKRRKGRWQYVSGLGA